MKRLLAALLGSLWAVSAFAQSSPGFVQGQIPSAPQWNGYFTGKLDVNNGWATGLTLNGGALSGSLSGTPTITGSWLFNAAPNLAAGATLSGTLAGSPTASGSWKFANPLAIGISGTNNTLTVTPGLGPTQPIDLTQSGTGGVVIAPELFLTGAGTGLLVTNATTLSGGGAFSGTFSGNHTYSGVVTFSGGVGGTLAGNIVEVNSINTYGNTITLSGSTVPTYMGKYVANWAGTSTVAGNTSLAAFNIGTASDNAAIANGTRNELLITGNYGGGTFDGFRQGVMVQMNFNTASTLSSSTGGAGGLESKVVPSANFGGSSASNLKGAFFGANPWADCKTGATFLSQCVGTEIDVALQTGASAGNVTGLQVVLTSDHATHGIFADNGYALVAQSAATAGLRKGFVIGSYQATWPIDPNGYLYPIETSSNYSVNPDLAAGGNDYLQVTFNGSGANGGNFAFRTQGASSSVSATAIDGLGALKLGSAYLNPSSASTLTLDTGLFAFNGISSVVSGGTNFTTGDLVDDGYGNIFSVTASAGVVSSLALKYRAEGRTSAPAVSSLAFNTLMNTANGTTRGSGLTVTENAWTQQGTTLNFGTTTATTLNIGRSAGSLGFYGATAIVKATPTGACAGNTGCQALRDALGNLGLINTGSITN